MDPCARAGSYSPSTRWSRSRVTAAEGRRCGAREQSASTAQAAGCASDRRITKGLRHEPDTLRDCSLQLDGDPEDAKESTETPRKSVRILLFPAVLSPDEVENSVADPLPDQIVRKIDEVKDSYHRLVLVVAPEGAGKTTALQTVRERLGAPCINLNLELSRRLLDLTERQRSLHIQGLVEEVVAEAGADLVLLDNIEILFDPKLQQDPLRCLQQLARHRTVVAAWGSAVADDGAASAVLTYAALGHPEYRRYSANDLTIVSQAMAPTA